MEFIVCKGILVKIDDNINKSNFISYVESAVSFLKNEFDIDEDIFKVRIFFSSNYQDDVKSVHIEDDGLDNANAMFIPLIFKKPEINSDNQEIIIVNWEKLEHLASNSIIVSVLVHKLVHYLDYLNYKMFSDQYGDFFENRKKRNRGDILGGYFKMRSEMRAKYYQEKYYCRSVGCLDSFHLNEHIKINHIIAKDSKDWNAMSWAWGQIKFWEEVSGNYTEIMEIIVELKKEMAILNSECKTLPLIFDWSDFCAFCESFKLPND